MALRANQPFVTTTTAGKFVFAKDQIVPSDIAANVPKLVYDDSVARPESGPYVRTARPAPTLAEAPADDEGESDKPRRRRG